MAGGLGFITANPALEGYDEQNARTIKQRNDDQGQAVDAAVRGGISDAFSGQQQTPPPAAPPPVSQPQANADPTLDQNGNPRGPTSSGHSFASAISGIEGSPTSVNPQGYSGKYQFGTANLASTGLYTPAPGENLTSNSWQGTINVPGYPAMNRQQFLANEPAQDAAFQATTANYDKEINQRGLSRYIGQTVAGMPVTQQSIEALMHFGGAEGAEQFLESGGRYNPADANGMTLARYGTQATSGTQYAGPGVPSAPGSAGFYGGQAGQPTPLAPPPQTPPPQTAAPATPAPTGMMGGMGFGAPGSTAYDSVLQRLAQTPGGGQAALGVLNSEGRIGMQLYQRNTAMQRLAMQALGRGDNDVAQFYAAQGGLDLPPSITQNGAAAKRLAAGSLLAHRFYENDPQQAAAFTQAYIQTGDPDQAFAAAGTPASKPSTTVQWVRQGNQELAEQFDPGSRTMRPIMDGSGQPVSRDVRQAPAGKPQWVTSQDGSSQTLYAPQPDGSMAPVNGQDGKPMTQGIKGGQHTSNLQTRVKLLMDGGMSEPDAARLVGGGAPSANTVTSTFGNLARAIDNDPTIDPAQRPAILENQMGQAFGPGWKSIMQGPGVAAPAAAAPPAPPPAATIGPSAGAPAAAPPPPSPASAPAGGVPQPPANLPPGSQFSPSRQQWRDPYGRIYDGQGNPVGTPTTPNWSTR